MESLKFKLAPRSTLYDLTMHTNPRYTDHAGLEISVNSRIESPFSRQVAIGNAGPV